MTDSFEPTDSLIGNTTDLDYRKVSTCFEGTKSEDLRHPKEVSYTGYLKPFNPKFCNGSFEPAFCGSGVEIRSIENGKPCR
jgi:hypothetical protein